MNLIHIVGGSLWGGPARYALDICRHYQACGWEVEAFTRGSVAVDFRFTQADVKVAHAPFMGFFDLNSVWLLRNRLKHLNPETTVIHAHGFRQAFLALLARKISGNKGVKIVMTRHKVRRGADSPLFRRIYRNLDTMIFVSQLACDRFLSTWHKRDLPFDVNKIKIIPDSLNLEDVTVVERQSRGPVTAMWHGTLVPGKGLETLIDAMSLIKGTRLRLKIVGTGQADYLDSLRRRAITRGVMEHIDWKKNAENVMEMMSEIDFGVLPSWTEEAFGLPNLEYMAAGRAQICSSNGAQGEYITDGREGMLVPTRNAGVLAEAMRKLASDKELRERMGRRAAETFRSRLSWPHFILSLDSIYQGK